MRLLLLVILSPAVGLIGCTDIVLFPTRDFYLSPKDLGVKFEEIQFPSADGTILYGWLLPADGTPEGTIVFAHGNAQNISSHIQSVYWLPAHGFNVFLFDYRGYGASEGSAEVEGAIADTKAGINFALSDAKLNSVPVIFYGQSLGGSVGLVALGDHKLSSQISGIVTEGSFSNFRQIVREKLGAFFLTWPFQYPLSFLISNQFSPLASISTLSPAPVLIVHGDADEIVPPHNADELFLAAKDPKELWKIPHIGHNDAFREARNREQFVTKLRGFLANKLASHKLTDTRTTTQR